MVLAFPKSSAIGAIFKLGTQNSKVKRGRNFTRQLFVTARVWFVRWRQKDIMMEADITFLTFEHPLHIWVVYGLLGG